MNTFCVLISFINCIKHVRVYMLVWRTVTGSSRGASMSVCLSSTLPRQARHNIRSNAARRSRRITPATNLHKCDVNQWHVNDTQHGGLHNNTSIGNQTTCDTRLTSNYSSNGNQWHVTTAPLRHQWQSATHDTWLTNKYSTNGKQWHE